jgi:hypothetical protein
MLFPARGIYAFRNRICAFIRHENILYSILLGMGESEKNLSNSSSSGASGVSSKSSSKSLSRYVDLPHHAHDARSTVEYPERTLGFISPSASSYSYGYRRMGMEMDRRRMTMANSTPRRNNITSPIMSISRGSGMGSGMGKMLEMGPLTAKNKRQEKGSKRSNSSNENLG